MTRASTAEFVRTGLSPILHHKRSFDAAIGDQVTLPLLLLFLLNTVDEFDRSAFAILTLIPFIFVYLRIERYVVGGITSGAVK